jgi:LysM repeat protein
MNRLLTLAAVAATVVTLGATASAATLNKEPAKKLAVVTQPTKVALDTTTVEAAPETLAPKMVTVAEGDYLSKIASDNGTTYLRMFYANTAISNPDLIFPGQTLRVPEAAEELSARDLPVTAPVEVKQQVAENPAVDTQPVAAPAPRRAATPVAAPAVGDGSVWDRLAMCEATGNWAINTGNGFYGGLQFTLSSWQAVGGTGLPSDASREEQIARGIKLQAIQGWGAWPACSAKLGLR